jgi:hypothetical protein
LIGFPLVLVLLVCVSISQDFRRKCAGALKATPWLSAGIISFSILEIVSIAVSTQPAGSLQKVIIQETNWTAIFFASCFIFLTPKRAEQWAAVLCLMSVPLTAIAFRENAEGQLPWAGHLPTFFRIQDPVIQRILAGGYREGVGAHRVQTTFTTPLGFSEYIALAAPFLLHFIANPYRLSVRIGAALLAPVLIYVVLLTDARLGLIGCILGSLLYLLFWAGLLWRRRSRSVFAPLIVLGYPVLAAAAMAAALFVGRIHERIFGAGEYDLSNESRIQMYHDGIPKILSHPWGYGAGMSAETLGVMSPEGFLTLDSYYLAIALDYGVLGFVVYYGMIVLAVGTSLGHAFRDRVRDADTLLLVPIAVSLTVYIMIKSVFSNDDNHPLVFMMMGMIAALAFRIKSSMNNSGPGNPKTT